MATPLELTSAIRADLASIEDLVRWCYVDGWTPRAPNREAGTKPIPMEARDQERAGTGNPDELAGPRFDTGLGVHRARETYTTAAVQLGRAYVELMQSAIDIAGVKSGALHRRWTVERTRPEPGELLAAIEAMRMATDVIDTGWAEDLSRSNDPDHTQLVTNTARSRIVSARRAVGSAWTDLTAYFRQGSADPDQHAADVELCEICELRPQSDKAAGHRCITCYLYWFRSHVNPAERHERPRDLDSVHQAERAQQRRTDRGEGWGDESFSSALVQLDLTPELLLSTFGFTRGQIGTLLPLVLRLARATELDHMATLRLAEATGKAATGRPYLLDRYDGISVLTGANPDKPSEIRSPIKETTRALQRRLRDLAKKIPTAGARA